MESKPAHVVVAERAINRGVNVQSLIGHFIHYVICSDSRTSDAHAKKNLSEKAFSPDEYK